MLFYAGVIRIDVEKHSEHYFPIVNANRCMSLVHFYVYNPRFLHTSAESKAETSCFAYKYTHIYIAKAILLSEVLIYLLTAQTKHNYFLDKDSCPLFSLLL